MLRMFNRYSLVARVYPALLALAPVLWTAIVLFPQLLSDYKKGAASALAIGCVLYLIANLARSRGKFAEDRLLVAWGGWSTTIVLRHRDGRIDHVTKERYHSALGAMIGRPLPTAESEAVAPADADDIYRSATKRLLEVRRGPKHQIIEDENASYGFRRNLFGLRPIAVGLAILAGVVTGIIWWARLSPRVTLTALVDSISTYPYLLILVTADLAYALLLALMVTEAFVRQAADEYALALLRSLEG